jgi:DNA-binding FadR family transcriptional regulator
MTENDSTMNIFEILCKDIAAGKYAPGSRLPAERELATQLSTSRPTLREALRRLEDWRMVEARRGSGIVVRDREEWSLQALPTFVREALRTPDFELKQMTMDILALRVRVYAEVLRLVSDREPDLTDARAKLDQAWEARRDPKEFLRHDFDVLRSILAAAKTYPALWLLNDIAGVYLPLAGLLGPAALPRDDYHVCYTAMLDDLDAGYGEAAAMRLTLYLERNDRDLLTAMGVESPNKRNKS